MDLDRVSMGDLKDKSNAQVKGPSPALQFEETNKMWKFIFGLGLGLSLDTGSDTMDTGSLYKADTIY